MQTGKTHLYTPLGIAGGIFLVLLSVRLASGFNGLYGQDAHEYLRQVRALFDFFQGGPRPGAFFWPLNYPLAGALLAFIVGTGPICLQLFSLLSLPGSFLYLSALLSNRYPEQKRTWLIVLLGFVLAPYLLRGTFLVMSDMPTLFLVCAVLFHLDRYGAKGRSRDLVWAGLAIGLAVFTRYPSGLLLLPLTLVMAGWAIKFKDWKGLLVVVPLSLLLVLPQFLLRSEAPLYFLENGLLQMSSPLHLFQGSYQGPDGYFSYSLPNGLFVLYNLFHPGFLFMGVFLLPFFKIKDLKGWFPLTLLIAWVVYVLFIGCLPMQNSRFLLISFPLLFILLVPAWNRAITWLQARSIPWVIWLILPVQLALFAFSARSHYRLYQLEHSLAKTLNEKYAGPQLYTFYVDGALKTYGVSNPVVNLWEVELTSAQPGELVLFNEAKFGVQWKGKNPMNNWNYLNQVYQLHKLEDFGEGWELYEIR